MEFSMALHRTHILLEAEQIDQLKEIARREERSVSEVARQLIQEGVAQIQEKHNAEKQRRILALENARRVRQAIRAERQGEPLDIDVVDLINQMREERDAEILGRGG
jgi:predicted DNA-binding ribbon-helix-helix protein